MKFEIITHKFFGVVFALLTAFMLAGFVLGHYFQILGAVISAFVSWICFDEAKKFKQTTKHGN